MNFPHHRQVLSEECMPQLTDNIHTLIFLHIPKAGGSTLGSILQRGFQADETLAVVKGYDPWVEIAALPEARRMQIKYVQGHVFYWYSSILHSPGCLCHVHARSS